MIRDLLERASKKALEDTERIDALRAILLEKEKEEFSESEIQTALIGIVIDSEDDELVRNVQILSEALVKLVYAFSHENINFFLDNN